MAAMVNEGTEIPGSQHTGLKSHHSRVYGHSGLSLTTCTGNLLPGDRHTDENAATRLFGATVNEELGMPGHRTQRQRITPTGHYGHSVGRDNAVRDALRLTSYQGHYRLRLTRDQGQRWATPQPVITASAGACISPTACVTGNTGHSHPPGQHP
jgi:hypothetical protein